MKASLIVLLISVCFVVAAPPRPNPVKDFTSMIVLTNGDTSMVYQSFSTQMVSDYYYYYFFK